MALNVLMHPQQNLKSGAAWNAVDIFSHLSVLHLDFILNLHPSRFLQSEKGFN